MKLVKFLIVFVFLALAIPAFAQENKISVNAGKNFMIELKSNPTTGYKWQLAEPLNERIVKLVSSDYLAPNTNLVGAGGKEIWIFKAVKKGEAKIILDYLRPWEKVKPEIMNVYLIEVK